MKDTGGKCPKCGGRMLLRRSAKGRVYYGCENYPNCDFMTWDEPVTDHLRQVRRDPVPQGRKIVLRQGRLRF